MKNNGYHVEGIITEPFRTQVIAIIKTETLQEAIIVFNQQYPKAFITTAWEIE